MEKDDNGNNSANDETEESSSKSRVRTLSENNESNEEKRQCIDIPQIIQHNEYLFPGVPASPPKFISLDQIMSAADAFSNMALAHEIAVNKDFILKKAEGQSSIEKQVKEVMHRAFWDLLETQLLEDPPNYSQALILLSEIKETIMGILLPHQTRIRNQIDEILDLDLIKQQVENDALDFHYYARFIISLMSRLCAPVRDEKVKELANLTDIIPLYKGILEALDLMKLDMANFTLQQMRPHIQQHSVEYERKKFHEFLTALKELTPPVDGLELTRKWLENVCEKVSTLNNEDASSSSSEVSSAHIITKAYLEVFSWGNDVLFPETLQMDQVRFASLKEQFHNVVLSASILLITYSIVGEAIQGISSLKEKMKDQILILLKDASLNSPEELKSKLESISLQVAKEVNDCLQEHGYNTIEQSTEMLLLLQIREIRSDEHSVKKLIKTRTLEFIEGVLNSPNAASVKFPAGLSAFFKELSSLAGQFLQLINHNRTTFNDIYLDIISEFKKRQS